MGSAGPALALVFNAFVWGVSWWPFRELRGQGLHPLWATAFVYFFSLACVCAARPAAWRAFRGQPLLWLLALSSGITNVAFNWAVTIGDVVRVVLLFYLMPAWTALLAWPLLGERPTPATLLRLALALAGVAIVLRPGLEGPLAPPHALSDWLGLAGGFTFSLTTILLRKMRQVPDSTRAIAMFGGGSALACAAALAGTAQGLLAPPAATLAALPLGLALALGFLGSNLAMQYGAARLQSHTTALLMLSEVVFAAVSSVLLGAARMTPAVVLGAALILGAAAWSALQAQPPRMDAP